MKALRTLFLFILVLAIVVPLWAYVTSRSLSHTGDIVQQKWGPGAFPLQWQINPIQGPKVTGSVGQEDVFKASFATWQALTTASISFAEGPPASASTKPGYDQINLITTNLAPADYPYAALGLTQVFSFDQGNVVDQFNRHIDFPGQIMEADIMFNPTTQFSTDTPTPSDKMDLQSVATHEIGHFVGLDHSGILSATMFPTLTSGANYPRTLSSDDVAGVSTIYPTASFGAKGTLTGTIRTTQNVPVYGALVTAVNANGQPVASAITDPNGNYTIAGLDSGSYTIYAEPLDQPITAANVSTLARIYGGFTVFTNFTTRFR